MEIDLFIKEDYVKNNLKIAIGSWAFILGPYSSHPVPLEEVIKKLGKLGFDGIELAGFGIHAAPDQYPTRKDRERLLEITRENGLEIPAYSADLQTYPFAEGNQVIMQKHEDNFKKALDFCVDCNIPAIRVDTVTKTPFPDNLDYNTTWGRVITVFRKLANKALSAGKTVLWEFEPGFIFNKPNEVVRLVEDVSSTCSNFKILFDTSHAHMCAVIASKQIPPLDILKGGVVKFIELLRGKIGHVHLADSDNTLHDDDTSNHLPLGHGILDFKRILKSIQKSGYDSPWWSIDLCFWPEAWQVVGESKSFLNTLFKELKWL